MLDVEPNILWLSVPPRDEPVELRSSAKAIVAGLHAHDFASGNCCGDEPRTRITCVHAKAGFCEGGWGEDALLEPVGVLLWTCI